MEKILPNVDWISVKLFLGTIALFVIDLDNASKIATLIAGISTAIYNFYKIKKGK